MTHEIEISVTPVILPHVEQAARAAQSAIDDMPPAYECTPRQLRLRDRLGEILVHSANAHRHAQEAEAILAAARHLAERVSSPDDVGALLSVLMSGRG